MSVCLQRCQIRDDDDEDDDGDDDGGGDDDVDDDDDDDDGDGDDDDGDDDGDNDEDSEGSDGSLTMPMLMPREGSQTRLWEQRSSSSAFVPSLIARICRWSPARKIDQQKVKRWSPAS